jgi:hypothetical protein
MNTEVRDALTGIQAAWTAYTPTLGNITLGNGTLACAFTRYGKTIKARGNLIAGTTTTFAAGVLSFSLPVVPHAIYGPGHAVGVCYLVPTPATRWPGVAFISGGGSPVLTFLSASAANAPATNLVPGTWASATTTNLSFEIEYEAA